MKALILVLALVSTTAFAREGHEGPEAAAKIPSPIVAKLRTGSGFAPPAAPRSIIVQIREDGTVELVRGFMGGKTDTIEVATLAKTLAEKVVAAASQVKETEIRDPHPEQHGCYDAPSATYIAVQGQKEIVVAADENCKEMEKVGATDADRTVKRILDAVSSLAYMTR